jgi:4a-hydroxytetrahydrobiopterin dehydratase
LSDRLSQMQCIPCRGGVPPLEGEGLSRLETELGSGWRVIDGHHLEKEYTFPDFASALGFVNRVGQLADDQDHHPDIYLAWGKAGIKIWTHKIGGLTESDFVFAARCDTLV